ncbi:unnamed protein product [Mucor hiemalis]
MSGNPPSKQETERKANEAYDKASSAAHDELLRVKAELAEFKRKSQPKIQEAENYLTSPSAIGFYQGVVVGVFVVLGYAKYKGGLVV